VSSLSLIGCSLPVREDIYGNGSDANFAVASFSASIVSGACYTPALG
jgi:hypothetical protein